MTWKRFLPIGIYALGFIGDCLDKFVLQPMREKEQNMQIAKAVAEELRKNQNV